MKMGAHALAVTDSASVVTDGGPRVTDDSYRSTDGQLLWLLPRALQNKKKKWGHKEVPSEKWLFQHETENGGDGW